MENTQTTRKQRPGTLPGMAPGGQISCLEGSGRHHGGGIFPLEPSVSGREGEKLDKPQDRLWSMGLASRVTLCGGVCFRLYFSGTWP